MYNTSGIIIMLSRQGNLCIVASFRVFIFKMRPPLALHLPYKTGKLYYKLFISGKPSEKKTLPNRKYSSYSNWT